MPNAAAWLAPKAMAAAALHGLNAHLPPSLYARSLAADFVQDDDGSWWMLQVRAHRLEHDKNDLGAAWRHRAARQAKDGAQQAEALKVAPRGKGRKKPLSAAPHENQTLLHYAATCESEMADLGAGQGRHFSMSGLEAIPERKASTP